ncbi:MAG: hypothetical protein ACTSP9_10730 [Promethearchaeota archaeon]
MHYTCPVCLSMKKPKIINYFPPVFVKCVVCGHEDTEKKFIIEEKNQYPIIG